MWSSTLASWHFAFQHHAHCSSTQCTVRPIGSTVTALGLVFITYCPVVRRISLQSPPLAFEPSRSLLLVSETICHNTSLLRLLFTSLHLGWKLCFLSRTVLNVQCLWSDFVIIRHSNRSSYLLTYLLTYIPPSCGVRPSDDASVCHVHVTCIASKRLNIFSNLWPSGKYTTPVFPC